MTKKVFVSWSGDAGRKIAKALQDTLLDTSEVEVWTSVDHVEGGTAWFAAVAQAAEECDAAIGCMTPGASHRQWVNFEAGMLYGRLQNFKMLRFNEELSGPLTQIQATDWKDQEDVRRLLRSLMSEKAADHQIKYVWKDWLTRAEEALRTSDEIEKSADCLHDAALELSRNAALTSNRTLRALIVLSLDRLESSLAEVTDTFSAPQTDYPFHLIELQKRRNATVQAIALLQQEEQFWLRSLGRQIRDTVSESSERIFVVRSEEQLEEHWDTILRHAKSYNVSVLSYNELKDRFEERFVRDFSIINVEGSRVAAAYEVGSGGRIQYMAHPSAVEEFERAFGRILQRSVRVDRNEPPEIEMFKAQVFTSKFTKLKQKPVEMSEYVPVEDYDAHEEAHAYYKEMMAEMIAAFRKAWPDANGPYRVLDMGAGTGIFTKRLVPLESIEEIVALEIDWACHQRLAYNVRNAPKVKPYNEDSRQFNPSGRYHAVFSSFADHHIKSQDKIDYLRNVKRNLIAGGVFIVGDEFLRPHDHANRAEKEAALYAYHNHIIDIAKKENENELVMLETAALESGLHERGDFKVSCDEYENHLRKSGFSFEKMKIGPADPKVEKEIGGVYVYVARVVSD